MKRPQATKKSSIIEPPLNGRPIPNFADIARMVTGSEPPRWLPAHLEWWAQGIRHDILVDQYRPSKLQTAERLLGVPDPPNSAGKSVNFGRPSFMGRTVSAIAQKWYNDGR
jgi:hypothetical protein